MNYRHAFHAGNFADVFKHIVLARVLTYLIRKPAALRYIDTHAGLGWYDLGGEAATRTGEWRDGIGLIDSAAASPDIRDLLAPYLDAVGPRDGAGKPFAYPGSPGLAQHILRPHDRLVLNELHPEDTKTLRAAMGRDKRVTVLALDGYVALNANVPPPERRGLVLIDPPFEASSEWDDMAAAVLAAHRKWPGGTTMLWFPVKDAAAVSGAVQRLQSGIGAETLEFRLMRSAASYPDASLRGCGLFVINPPYVLEGEVRALAPFLAASLGRGDPTAWHIHLAAMPLTKTA